MGQDHSSASFHLKIPLHEYDSRIRTFVPFYEEMLEVVGRHFSLIAAPASTVLELGIGTGALAERCRRETPGISVIGIDMDAEMLTMARARLGSEGVELRAGSYLDVPLPSADYIITSLSLHHVREPAAKRALYRRCRTALRPGGALIMADCYAPRLDVVRDACIASWRRFLEQYYSAAEARAYLDAWAEEDTYMPLSDELQWLTEAGFRPDVVWRRDLFAVLVAG